MNRRIKELSIEIISLLLALLVAASVIVVGFEKNISYGTWLNRVDGRSMEPTLKNGQWVFSDLFGEIEYGDIITLELHESEDMNIIKRVIGMPGDKVCIQDKGVFINNQLLEENYLTEDAKDKTLLKNIVYRKVVLADDEYYVMGDNRGLSNDSRFFGPVNASEILYEQSVSPTKSFVHTSAIIFLILIVSIIVALGGNKLFVTILYRIFRIAPSV